MSSKRRRTEMVELIEKSSLGSPEARVLRTLTEPTTVARAHLAELRRRADTGDAAARARLADLAAGRTEDGCPVIDDQALAQLQYETARGAYEPAEDSPAASGESSVRRLGTELWSAVAGGGLSVCYQPKVEMATGVIRGAEALVRWYHPDLGRVRPSKLVRVAERTGAIRPLTMWVMNQAVNQCQGWRERGWNLGVAVNLSARNLVDRQLPADVADLLDVSGFPASSLTLEITETMVVGESQRSLDVLHELVAIGVRLSCDDFGTGYSSLARLRKLPVHEIKVDSSFVARIVLDDTDRAITRSILALGRGLGLTTVAEGVEDRETWDILRAFGCDLAQGFMISRALTPEKFIKWMKLQPASALPGSPKVR